MAGPEPVSRSAGDPATANRWAAGLGRCAWALLASLLAATFAGAVFYDRAGWAGRVAGESTYLMQAASLAADFDLTYTRADFDRMLLADLANPTDLSLVSGSAGRRIAFDRPFPYALYLAPFVRTWPRQGFAVANALLLAFVSVYAARTLKRRAGPWSPVWVTILVFASALFAYVFLATGDLFLFAVTVLAFCLIARDADAGEAPAEPTAGARSRRWLAAGALLAIPAATAPLYLVLGLAAFFAASGRRRGACRAALGAGFLASFLLQALVGWWAGGGLYLLGASSFRFTPETGYPLVDFTAAEWRESVRRLSAFHWDGAPRFSWGFDPRLWAWNGLYLLAGRSIGILPYFPPVVMLAAGALAGFRRPIARPIVLAAAAWAAGVLIFQPFNVYGGGGAVANRLFLPVYGALWMLAAAADRRTRVAAVASVALAAPFLWPLWTSSRSHPIDGERGYAHVASAARVLPFETSQRWLPGSAAAEHNGLTVKFFSGNAWAETRRGRLAIEGEQPVDLMIASTLPLDVLRFDFGKDAPSGIGFAGGRIGERVLAPGGGISFRVLPQGWTRRHPMWWTPQRQWLYLLTLELPAAPASALGFEIQGERLESR